MPLCGCWAQARRDSDITAWVNVIHGCNEKVGGWRVCWPACLCLASARLLLAWQVCLGSSGLSGGCCQAPTPLPHATPPPLTLQCTYCIVPFTRGAEQSRTPDAIRREMLSLGEAGYKEVTLLGQNIDAYGRDLPGFAADGSGRRACTFTDLLRYVHDVPGGWGALNGWVGGRCRCWAQLAGVQAVKRHRAARGAQFRAGTTGWIAGDKGMQCSCASAARRLILPCLPCCALAGIERIRFATSHPRYFTERLIK